ncbi:hypothetical protein Hanom_Chr12g01155521 [Helianthus anomalus]
MLMIQRMILALQVLDRVEKSVGVFELHFPSKLSEKLGVFLMGLHESGEE